ncbi:hypothetical protein NEOLEDRAFT_1139919 [Neolentinus lepideus HHB14362 ss-1]|uniref:Uncharacterized protein n=1 Tax=Neolentinus lepideus HHB14362 ss-1 TaxID=1314782 RepID=A0A165PI38_9AGAM|nr:hypothetical protein NEOLEDRAFT_1139919 [Neolentinus lepideus HHB14362 ss-1]
MQQSVRDFKVTNVLFVHRILLPVQMIAHRIARGTSGRYTKMVSNHAIAKDAVILDHDRP